MNLEIITTGGAIGARLFPNPAAPPAQLIFSKRTSPVERLFRKGFCSLTDDEYSVFSIGPVASIRVGGHSYRKLVHHLKISPIENVLITHDIGTALPLAERLASRPTAYQKRVVIVGANIPLLNGSISDGFQNLSLAIKHLVRPANEAERPQIGVSLVLSDYDRNDSWQPRMYPFVPGRYYLEQNPHRGDRMHLKDKTEAGARLRRLVGQPAIVPDRLTPEPTKP